MAEDNAFCPGDPVLTTYGAGVIVQQRKDSFYAVRIWRIPGKSMASSALALLAPSAVLERLPVAPGMVTRLKAKEKGQEASQVLVYSYDPKKRLFCVTLADSNKEEDHEDPSSFSASKVLPAPPSFRNGDGGALQYVSAENLATTAPSAKFYPILESLLHRAQETADATRDLLQSDRATALVDQTGKLVQDTATQLLEGTDQPAGRVGDLADKAQEIAPHAEKSFQEVLTLMKDEQLTDLLSTCQERLQELVKTTDLSEATEQVLQKTGIKISLPTEQIPKSMQESRQVALSALEGLLSKANLDPSDLTAAREQVAANFTQAFDSLSKAAKSDRGLNDLFESVAEKTSAWQQATGRLLQTRSASLFMEGASRLHMRAAAILKRDKEQGGRWDIGSRLTKSFTEGDAALARIKSVELGEAVKTRLVEAIQLRSESVGGLDGIIAGALSSIREKSDSKSANQIQDLLVNLQNNATSVTSNTHETLLAVLSSGSKYQEVTLLRVEHVLCSLEHQLGDNFSAEQIAAVARGEGGTSQLFEPIAKKAMVEIDKNLDLAESQITDATVLEVLKRVRKITSGEMSLNAVMDEIVGVLNDDKVVAVGETIVQHSEHVLDAIEGVSANKAVVDAMHIAERAGITKDSVMREIGKLNVDALIDEAGSAVTDERARQRLIASATDAALDFALRVIPSMPVPPFEGVNDGLVYEISNLSMEGFRVRKEDIQLELAGLRATKKPRATDDTSDLDDKGSGTEISPSLSGESALSADGSIEVQEVHSHVKATELLIIDIQRISAVFTNAKWSFEQTYMPYLKGDGLVDVKMSEGAIRLVFELRRRRRKTEDGEDEWEPVLCLHDRSCAISDVELNWQGDSRLAWILNKLASIFKGPLRDYVVKTIVKVVTNKSGWILQQLNGILSPYWDLILRTAKLKMDDLVEADDDVVLAEESPNKYTIVELVWRERLPLGMNLLTNDASGELKVVDFPRGSQARGVCEKRNLDPKLFEGASVIAVNGTEHEHADELFDALREPGRPKTVRFRLAHHEEAEKVRRFVDASKTNGSPGRTTRSNVKLKLRGVEFTKPGDLGIEFVPSIDSSSLRVSSFLQHDDGIVFAAERSGRVSIGDVLVKVNDEMVSGKVKGGSAWAIQLLEKHASSRPLVLQFSDPYAYHVQISKIPPAPGVDSNGGPDELVIEELPKIAGVQRIAISDFKEVNGMAETGGILIGDHLVFVNGAPVGAGCRWLGIGPAPNLEDIYNMLRDENAYPIGLTFARPRQEASGWDSALLGDGLLRDDQADTICVTAESQERIGCLFDQTPSGDILVRDFFGVSGVFQRFFNVSIGHPLPLPLSIESINGQFVPSYASVDMVRNAIKRAWKQEEELNLTLCNDERKTWLDGLTSQP